MESKLVLIRFIHSSQPETLRDIAKRSAGRTLPKSKGTVAAALRLAMRNASFSSVLQQTATNVLSMSGTSAKNYPLRFVAGLAWDVHPTWSGELGLQWMLEDYARVVFRERKGSKGGLMHVVSTLDNLDNNADRRTMMQNAPDFIDDEDQLNRLTAALRDIAQPIILLVATITKHAQTPQHQRHEPEKEKQKDDIFHASERLSLISADSDSDSDISGLEQSDRSAEKLERIVDEANRTKLETNTLRDRYRRLLAAW